MWPKELCHGGQLPCPPLSCPVLSTTQQKAEPVATFPLVLGARAAADPDFASPHHNHCSRHISALPVPPSDRPPVSPRASKGRAGHCHVPNPNPAGVTRTR